MNNKIYYGQTHIFTDRTNDSEINLKSGAGERLKFPNLKITSSTVSNLVIDLIETATITNSTVGNLSSSSNFITNSTMSSLISSNSQFTNGSISNLNVSVGTIGTLRNTNSLITSHTGTNYVCNQSIITRGTCVNSLITNGTITNLTTTGATIGKLNLTGPLITGSYITGVQPALFLESANLISISTGANMALNGFFWDNYTTQGSMTFNPFLNGYFTVPITGLYHIAFQMAFDPSFITSNCQIGIEYNNRASVVLYSSEEDISPFGSINCNSFLYMESGINYNTYAYIEYLAGGTLDTKADAAYNRFMCYYIA